MALTIGELVGFIRADGSDFERGLARSQLRMEGFRLDVNGRLRDVRGRFVRESEVMGRSLADGFSDAERAGTRIVTVYSSVADAQSRTLRGRFQQILAAGRRMGGGLSGVWGRARSALAGLDTDRLRSFAAGLGRIAISAGRTAGMLGAAAPAASALVAALANIAPAAGVGVTAMLAIKQATFAVQLGTQGMGDALKVALDPSKAQEFNDALKKLAPEARQFAVAVRDLGPTWQKLQQNVQQELFRGLSEILQRTAKSVLPVVRTELSSTASALNNMARGALVAAQSLADNGTLGKAMGSASNGLHNLAGVPEVVVTALGQIAAAAGPSFERLTQGAGYAAQQIGVQLSKAFESGAMQDAIENAITLIGALVDVARNVGSILMSVFEAAQVSGGGFIGTLQTISGALAEAFASPAVQDGLKALFSTMSTLAQTAAPLLGQALGLIAPVLAELGPPVQTLIKALGDALSPIIDALGPVLKAAAQAVGVLVEAIAPLLPVVGDLVAALLPALTPLLDAVSEVFGALAPVVEDVAGILQDALSPILAALPGIIAPLAQIIADRLIFFIQFLGDLLVQLGPSLVTLGQTFGELMVALSPLIQALADLTSQLLTALMPILQPLIGLIATLAQLFATGLAAIITTVVVPVLQILAKLLSGDFSGAWDLAKQAVQKAKDWIGQAASKIGPLVAEAVAAAIRWLNGMPGRAYSALSTLAGNLRSRAADAGAQLVSAVRQKLSDAVTWIKGLPGRAKSALGDLTGILASAGRKLIQGFINGIVGKFGDVKSTLGNLTSNLTSWKGPEDVDKRILTPAGRMVIAGFQRGIADQIPALRAQLHGLTGEVPGMALGGMSGSPAAGGGTAAVRIVLDGPEAMTRLIRGIVQDKGGGNVQLAFGR